jgi:hypothetical protein
MLLRIRASRFREQPAPPFIGFPNLCNGGKIKPMTSHFRNDPDPMATLDKTHSRIEKFEYSQRAKPLKALIGVGILIAVVLALWGLNPDRPSTTATPNASVTTDMNRAPGQTTGQTPARPAPPPSSTQ